ncbi:putative Peptidyl-prolyl cis-trans isomerase CYP59 [Paratrimastix pyriformis]|uniref:Peptidyl-prolyl cis-trans isomerase n=1 Tax=Paratrimastix pyriformis TaxID=342808 RepID=A0ABQ8UQI4_9EUKA|nr:putative Peptidyl-prolyl cis-trans isomerase CYP59 [Paratrimastix pyriformis]
MSVLIETSQGDIVIDLFCDDCPLACKNFLKLCKIHYYNQCLFHNVQHNYIVQTGDPSGTGLGGESIYGILNGPAQRFFEDEIHAHLRHDTEGTVSMAKPQGTRHQNGSQFIITAAPRIPSLDEQLTVFGRVTEGMDIVRQISSVWADEKGRPYQNVRIYHTIILADPFADPPGLVVPATSPVPEMARIERLLVCRHAPSPRPVATTPRCHHAPLPPRPVATTPRCYHAPLLPRPGDRFEDYEEVAALDPNETVADQDERIAAREARANAVVLEMLGDLPEAEARPPENVLFVCRLNATTPEADLMRIFSQFGKIISCEVIRDHYTGESLRYAFIEFDTKESCEAAYAKMDNALIDDHRIHVDFSQSVAKNKFMQFRNQQRIHRGGAAPGRGRGGPPRGRGARHVVVGAEAATPPSRVTWSSSPWNGALRAHRPLAVPFLAAQVRDDPRAFPAGATHTTRPAASPVSNSGAIRHLRS